MAAFQSRADVIDRWGATGAAKIINNSGAIVVFGGTKDEADLEHWSKLAGDRDEPVATTNESGRVTARTVRKVPVLAPAQLANLPKGRVVVFTRGMSPVIGLVRMAWRRRDVRAHARTAAAGATRATPVPSGAPGAPAPATAPERVWVPSSRADRP